MAPSPETDNTPKAPDKNNEKTKHDADNTPAASAPENKHTSVSKLNDGELKALLDEAITYKNPKDREGKSDLFKGLLLAAEEDERKTRATSAGGSELVRYCNPSAKRHGRHRRQTSSVSENVTHGGSLNNLTKEELYSSVSQQKVPKKTVSARAKEGGSLPCDVNRGWENKQFLEEVKVRKQNQKKMEYSALDMESQSLLEHDALNQNYGADGERDLVPPRIPPEKYTSRMTLQVGGNVDEAIPMAQLDKPNDIISSLHEASSIQGKMFPSTCNFVMHTNKEDRRVDENGNALGQNAADTKKNKKKKEKTEKNVDVTKAECVAGHRFDIINDLDKLVEFIGGNDETGAKPKNNVHKSKLHKHVTGEEKTSKKHRTRSKGKNTNPGELKKSTSLDEMSSTSKLNDLENQQGVEKVALRATKSGADRTRERRSWGNTELQLYTNVSAENLETAEFRVVTKKKKSKKRRNSVSSGLRPQYARSSASSSDFNRVPSPELRHNIACSAPHSEKSDSSDVDSVHSLPIDTKHRDKEEELPVSYADIAKNSSLERPKWNRPPSERKAIAVKEEKVKTQAVQTSPRLQQHVPVAEARSNAPDVSSAESFPSINKGNKQAAAPTSVKVFKNSGNNVKGVKTAQGTNKVAGVKVQNVTNHVTELDDHLNFQNIQGTLQPMPRNIPDVQTIEKMHFAQANYNNNGGGGGSGVSSDTDVNNVKFGADCDTNRTTTANSGEPSRPAVVILSGDGNKEVSGLVFGFEINERLLCDDVYNSFVERFAAPSKHNTNAYNHDKIVNFIGQAWEDIVINQSMGRIQYYTEEDL